MEINVKKIVVDNELSINEVANFLKIEVDSITDDYVYDFDDVDDLDDFSKQFKLGVYDIVTLRGFGKTKRVVLFWNYLTEDWEQNATHDMEVIDEQNDLFSTEKEANEFLKKLLKDSETADEELEANATDEEKEEYENEKSVFEENRDSFRGYC